MHLLTMGVVASTVRARKYLLVPLVILAWIVLPTGTPEDLVTSIPLIAWMGFTNYVILCLVVVALMFFTGVWQEFYRQLSVIGPFRIAVVMAITFLVLYQFGLLKLQIMEGLI